MEQEERAVVDPSELNTEQGGEAPATGEVAGAEEGASEVDSSVSAAVSEGAKKHDLEEHSPESDDEVAAASGGVGTEDHGASQSSFAAHSEFGAAAAEVPLLGASSSSAPARVTGAEESVPALAGGDQGAAPGPGDDKKLKRCCSAPGVMVKIAHASPPDSYRRVPWRSRKQHSPKRFVAAAAESSSSSSGRRPPSRGRKQPRPENFVPEEDAATFSARARRSNTVLDRFLTSLVLGSSASVSEWVRNVTAANAAPGASGSGTRAATPRSAASEPHGAACSDPRRRKRRRSAASEPHGAARSPPCQRRRRCRLSCVLFNVVGQRSEHVPSLEKQDE